MERLTMTNEEIESIRQYCVHFNCPIKAEEDDITSQFCDKVCDKFQDNCPFMKVGLKLKSYEAEDMAIQALEEIQQYRAIGTVEGYERAIQSSIENYNLYREYKAKVQEYEAIGTIEELQELKRKSVAKKPIKRTRFNLTVFSCPTCNAGLYSYQRFCDECGQSILNDYD